MSPAASPADDPAAGLIALMDEARTAAEALLGDAIVAVSGRVSLDGRPDAQLMAHGQRATHGLAWFATCVQAIRQLAYYAEWMAQAGRLGETEMLLVRIGAGECFAQMAGGIPMSQCEMVRPADLGLHAYTVAARIGPAIGELVATGNTAENRARLVALMAAQPAATAGDCGLDGALDAMRERTRGFVDAEIAPHTHHWRLAGSGIPPETIARMAGLDVFALTLPEEFGGMGLGKESMCVVTEELSRGCIGAGSIAANAEIATELILTSGTVEQKSKWLPAIASGAALPAAASAGPDAGSENCSDPASLYPRAVREGDVYKVTGGKTWVTSLVSAGLMPLPVRTGEDGDGGLSVLLAEKPGGSNEDPFPVPGMSGTEIEVLGGRGVKAYEVAFDSFEVSADAVLGGVEGHGFKQLMQTVEVARIQTAARGIGVAQAAMEAAMTHANLRAKFDKPLIAFPRVADKIAMMAAEIMTARQMTYAAARQKDKGHRCDLEAGMAKLFAARAAWAAADNAVQIHGADGIAPEHPVSRLLCDARSLSIFDGAAESQAEAIARRLLEDGD
jgi:(2S)-methylsuccinyl-CoA dehydrogenase